MSFQITTAFVQQYRSNVELLIQQRQSKLEMLARRESQNAQYEFFETIGPVSAQPWGPRHGDTPLMETPHMRRRNGIFPWIWADLIDKPDRVRTLIEPTSPYALNAVMAFNRRKDDIIIKALTDTVWTGHEGTVPVTLPAANQVTLPGRMTLQALIDLRQAFWNDDVEDEEGGIAIIMSPNQIAALMEDVKVQSADYNTVRALVNGDIDSFMGFKFIRSTRLPSVQNGATFNTTAIAVVNGGLLMGYGQDLSVEITSRADKKHSTQVFVSMDLGATRMDEKKVRTITTADTAKAKPAP